jgi:hopene-associated glycosyltransferase HpnB
MSASPLTVALACLGAASLTAWLVVLALPWRPWDLRPTAEDEAEPPAPGRWPSVCAVVPARDESGSLPQTLPALAGQDYPGDFGLIVVDDRSTDGTGELARRLGGDGLEVVTGAELPRGWAGKVWALEQGRLAAGAPDYLLLTDADIAHAPWSVRRLVAESEAAGLALNSRMALLRCEASAERLLIPPFLFFFNLLYPMRRANDSRDRLAAAAGGCMLVRRDAIERIGGLGAIRGEIIDDVNLARHVKGLREPIRLSVSRSDVVSVREYETIGPIWRMVRRSAFDELGYSWVRLAGTIAGLLLLFAVPPALFFLAATGYAEGGWHIAIGSLGGAAWLLMAAVFLRTVRHFRLWPGWALTLPVGGILYGGMTIDSAFRHLGRVRRGDGDARAPW